MTTMKEDLIKHMVSRFLSWKLPENFHPDCGITFVRDYNQNTAYPAKHEPVGTNLFTADQATAMFEYVLDGRPPISCEPIPLPRQGSGHMDSSSTLVADFFQASMKIAPLQTVALGQAIKLALDSEQNSFADFLKLLRTNHDRQ